MSVRTDESRANGSKPTNERESKRDRLERYVLETHGTQRQLRILGIVGGLAAVIAWFFASSVAMWILVLTAFVVGIGYYITGMHIQSWQLELYEMRQTKARPRRTAQRI